MEKISLKNPKIELMRFVFCMAVILFHTNINFIDSNKFPIEGFTFFSHGKIGVEFFFLVSGYLMAVTANRQKNLSMRIEKDTSTFILKKYMGVFPYHLIAFAIAVVLYYVINPTSFFRGLAKFVTFLPNLFLIQTVGIYSKNLLGVEWYISSMIIAMMILYPFLLRFKKLFAVIVCPTISILLIGYMSHSTGELGQVSQWVYDETIPKTLVRALSELCMGIFCYYVTCYLKKLNFSKTDKVILTAVEFICYSSVVIFMCLRVDNKFETYAFLALAAAIILSFSEITYFNSFLKNRLVYFIGKLSLPLYLSQSIVFMFIKNYCANCQFRYKVIFVLAGCFVISLVVMILGKKLSFAFSNKFKILQSNKYTIEQ